MSAAPISRYDGGQVSSVQVRLTSDRVRRWEFGGASFTRRGYDPADVDRFRMQVADELDVLATQVANLRAENERLNDHLELHRHGVIPSTGAAAKLPAAKEVNLLSAAQREAEQIIAQAHDYAQRVAEYARMQYESYMRAAVEEAKQEAERAVADYRSSAGANFEDSVAAREALRIFGEMMISHMQAAARHLDNGSEQLSRTMERIAAEVTGGAPPAAAARVGGGAATGAAPVGGGRVRVALPPRHQQR
ncbi:DivIVA domain-containing protein [Micromonospora sp. DR5-3]|uniref:DivIVA domain-containing protein n=1 Tax=unclassified Micromonospora TaxID=2617518 RepID=UPI0011DA4AC7|nr:MULTISPECIES: DivIVA domain-containing protein [unclassified Micromonospora]MCW3818665.1 DivIVA domain-containing protein [Micromonospora sp. DR5-3]TYC21135.1 DivIVA domain-containing protein [Micromonospora sp. MP36]